MTRDRVISVRGVVLVGVSAVLVAGLVLKLTSGDGHRSAARPAPVATSTTTSLAAQGLSRQTPDTVTPSGSPEQEQVDQNLAQGQLPDLAQVEAVKVPGPEITGGWPRLPAATSPEAAVSPEPGQQFDPAAFLAEGGTLYLLGTATGHTVTAGLVAALIEDVVDTARRAAATSRGARLDPPLALVLDEAGNYPLDSLPSLMSEGGGTGISTMVILQSLAQARHQRRVDRARAIWDAATVKIVLGGSGDADDLADLSRLLGEVEVAETSEHVRAGETTTSISARHRPIMTAAQLRTLPAGQAVLLLRTADPIHLTLSPWTARPDAKELQAAKTEIEDTIRDAAAKPSDRVEPPRSELAVLPVWGPALEPASDDAVSLDVLKEDS